MLMSHVQLLPALWQFPRSCSCRPQSPSQWGLEQLSRGVQRWAVLALEQGPCRGLQQEGKFPISYLAPPSHPCHSAHFLREVLWSLQTTEFFLLPHPAPPFHLMFVFLCCLLFAPFKYCWSSLALGVLTSGCCVAQPGEELHQLLLSYSG